MRSEKPDLGSERSDLESKRPDLGSERLYLRLGGDGRTDGRKPEKIALCGIIGHRPLRGRCPKRTGCSSIIMVSGSDASFDLIL